MIRSPVGALAVSATIFLAAPGGAADAQGKDLVAAGRAMSIQACADCHVVAHDQKSPPMLAQRVPTFAEIANRPGVTPASLRSFMETTQWNRHAYPVKMPNMWLTRDQENEIVAYILSLKGAATVSGPIASPVAGESPARRMCLDKCVAYVHTHCIIGYCLRTGYIFNWIEKASTVIKRCQADCR